MPCIAMAWPTSSFPSASAKLRPASSTNLSAVPSRLLDCGYLLISFDILILGTQYYSSSKTSAGSAKLDTAVWVEPHVGASVASKAWTNVASGKQIILPLILNLKRSKPRTSDLSSMQEGRRTVCLCPDTQLFLCFQANKRLNCSMKSDIWCAFEISMKTSTVFYVLTIQEPLQLTDSCPAHQAEAELPKRTPRAFPPRIDIHGRWCLVMIMNWPISAETRSETFKCRKHFRESGARFHATLRKKWWDHFQVQQRFCATPRCMCKSCTARYA